MSSKYVPEKPATTLCRTTRNTSCSPFYIYWLKKKDPGGDIRRDSSFLQVNTVFRPKNDKELFPKALIYAVSGTRLINFLRRKKYYTVFRPKNDKELFPKALIYAVSGTRLINFLRRKKYYTVFRPKNDKELFPKALIYAVSGTRLINFLRRKKYKGRIKRYHMSDFQKLSMQKAFFVI